MIFVTVAEQSATIQTERHDTSARAGDAGAGFSVVTGESRLEEHQKTGADELSAKAGVLSEFAEGLDTK